MMENDRVALLGVNSIFGKISSLLLKQSDLVRRLALYDEFNVDTAKDISVINTNCKVEAFLGKEKLNDALKDADVVIIGDENLSTPHTCFDLMAPKICDYAKAIATSSPNAIVVVAASPVNILLPLLSEVLIECGAYNSKRIIGAMAVDNARASSILAAHMKVSPQNVTLPVVGGTSKTTRVPLISQAKPSVSFPHDVVKRIITDVRNVDNQIFSLKKTPEALNKAYTTVQFLKSMLIGLKGSESVTQIAFTRTNLIPQVDYFALPVQIGQLGVKKTFGLPPLLPFEEEILDSSIQSLQLDVEQARQFFKSNELDSFTATRSSKKVYQNEREEPVLKKESKSGAVESLNILECEDLTKNNLSLLNQISDPFEKSYFKTNYSLDCFNKKYNNKGNNYKVNNFGIINTTSNECASYLIDNNEESQNEKLSQLSGQLESRNKLPYQYDEENKLKSPNKSIRNKIDMLLLESKYYTQDDKNLISGDDNETFKHLSKKSLMEDLVKNMTNKTLEEERNQTLINEKRIYSELKKKMNQGIENKLNDLLNFNKYLSESKPTPIPQKNVLDIPDMECVNNTSTQERNKIDLLKKETVGSILPKSTPEIKLTQNNELLDYNLSNFNSRETKDIYLYDFPEKSFSRHVIEKQTNDKNLIENNPITIGENVKNMVGDIRNCNPESPNFSLKKSFITQNKRKRFPLNNETKYTDKVSDSLELSNIKDQRKKSHTEIKSTPYLAKDLQEKNNDHTSEKNIMKKANKLLEICRFSDRSYLMEDTDQKQFNNTHIENKVLPDFSEDSFLREAVKNQQLSPKSSQPDFSHTHCRQVFLQRILSSFRLQNIDKNNIEPDKLSPNKRDIDELKKNVSNFQTRADKAKDKNITNSSTAKFTQLDISKSLNIKHPAIHNEKYSSYFNSKQIVSASDVTKDNKFMLKKKLMPEININTQDKVLKTIKKSKFSPYKEQPPMPNLLLNVNKKATDSHKDNLNDTAIILNASNKKIIEDKKLKPKDSTQKIKVMQEKTLSYLKRRNEIFKQFFNRPENISVQSRGTKNESVDCLIENLFTEVEDSCELSAPVEISSNEPTNNISELQENKENNQLKPDCNNSSNASNTCEQKPTVVTFPASSHTSHETNQCSGNENTSISISTNDKIVENKVIERDPIIKKEINQDNVDSERGLSDSYIPKNDIKELSYPFTDDQDFSSFTFQTKEKSSALCSDKYSLTTSDSCSERTKTPEKLLNNEEQKYITEKKVTNPNIKFDGLQCKKNESKITFKRNLGRSVQNFALKKSLLPPVKETDIKSEKVHTNITKSNNINGNSNHEKSCILNNTVIHNFSKPWMYKIKNKTNNNQTISYIDYIRKSQPPRICFAHNAIYSRGDEAKFNKKPISNTAKALSLTEVYARNSIDANTILTSSIMKSTYNERINNTNKPAQYSTSTTSVRRKSPSRQVVDIIKLKKLKKNAIKTNQHVITKQNPHNTLLKILNKNYKKKKSSNKSIPSLKFHLSSKLSRSTPDDINKYFYNRNLSHVSHFENHNISETTFSKKDINDKSLYTLLKKSLNKKHNFLNEEVKVLETKNGTQVKPNNIFNHVTDSTSSYLYRKNLLKEKRYFHTNTYKYADINKDYARQSTSKIYENFIESRSMANIYKMYTKNLMQFEYSRCLKMPFLKSLQGGTNSIK